MSEMLRTASARLGKLRRAMKKSGVPAMLVTKFVNVTYLTGFTGDDSYLLVTPKDAIVLTDFRYTTQLEEECPGIDVEVRQQGVSLLDLLERITAQLKVREIGLEADSVTAGLHQQIEGRLSKVKLALLTGLVEGLREIKDRHEIATIRQSIEFAQRAFGMIRAGIRPEQTERLVAAEIEYQIRQFGGGGCSFAPIVAVGPRAALPHATPTDARIDEAPFVLIDWGALADGYASDLTRVLVTGKISPKLERIYGVVLKAQQRAIESIRPGVLMSEVDKAARSHISKAGFGKQFGHGLGHGIGLEIHEAPRLAVNQDRPLQAGMVVTVEPGIYLPGWGGVRIEDDVLVTKDGHEVLTNVPKEFDQCAAG